MNRSKLLFLQALTGTFETVSGMLQECRIRGGVTKHLVPYSDA